MTMVQQQQCDETGQLISIDLQRLRNLIFFFSFLPITNHVYGLLSIVAIAREEI
jgi:hypothetical protein